VIANRAVSKMRAVTARARPRAPAVGSSTRNHGAPGQQAARARRTVRVGAGSGDDDTSSDLAAPYAGMGTDWREFRARLVQQERASAGPGEDRLRSSSEAEARPSGMWAHAIPGPEQGCLLIAHPLMFTNNQTYFHQAVLFVFSHADTGTVGLILNKPTKFVLGGVHGAEVLSPEFSAEPLFLGGDVGRDTLHVLHPHPHLEGAQPVLHGVCIGGFRGAKDAVQRGDARPEDFRWFTRYAGWAPGQLEAECQQGVWFTAAAGKDLVLQRVTGTGQEMWHQVLELMGGEYADLSRAMRVSSQDAGVLGNGKEPKADERRD